MMLDGAGAALAFAFFGFLASRRALFLLPMR
jgi:hypothetical protein